MPATRTKTWDNATSQPDDKQLSTPSDKMGHPGELARHTDPDPSPTRNTRRGCSNRGFPDSNLSSDVVQQESTTAEAIELSSSKLVNAGQAVTERSRARSPQSCWGTEKNLHSREGASLRTIAAQPWGQLPSTCPRGKQNRRENTLQRGVREFCAMKDPMSSPTSPPALFSPPGDTHRDKPQRSPCVSVNTTNNHNPAGPTGVISACGTKSSSTWYQKTNALAGDKQRNAAILNSAGKASRPPPIICVSPNSRSPGHGHMFNSPGSAICSENSSEFSSRSYEVSSSSEWEPSPRVTPKETPALQIHHSISRGDFGIQHNGLVSSASPASSSQVPSMVATGSDQLDLAMESSSTSAVPVARARGFDRPLPRPAMLSSPRSEMTALLVDRSAGYRGVLGALLRPQVEQSDFNAQPGSSPGDDGHQMLQTSASEQRGRREQEQRADSLLKAGVVRLAGSRVSKIEYDVVASAVHSTENCSPSSHAQKSSTPSPKCQPTYWAPWRSLSPPSHRSRTAAGQSVGEREHPQASPLLDQPYSPLDMLSTVESCPTKQEGSRVDEDSCLDFVSTEAGAHTNATVLQDVSDEASNEVCKPVPALETNHASDSCVGLLFDDCVHHPETISSCADAPAAAAGKPVSESDSLVARDASCVSSQDSRGEEVEGSDAGLQSGMVKVASDAMFGMASIMEESELGKSLSSGDESEEVWLWSPDDADSDLDHEKADQGAGGKSRNSSFRRRWCSSLQARVSQTSQSMPSTTSLIEDPGQVVTDTNTIVGAADSKDTDEESSEGRRSLVGPDEGDDGCLDSNHWQDFSEDNNSQSSSSMRATSSGEPLASVVSEAGSMTTESVDAGHCCIPAWGGRCSTNERDVCIPCAPEASVDTCNVGRRAYIGQHSVDMSIDYSIGTREGSLMELDDESVFTAGAEGLEDSDAESEYTPEEALEVLRRAAIRFSVASGRRESIASVTPCSNSPCRNSDTADFADSEDDFDMSICTKDGLESLSRVTLGEMDDDCASRWSSCRGSVADAAGSSRRITGVADKETVGNPPEVVLADNDFSDLTRMGRLVGAQEALAGQIPGAGADSEAEIVKIEAATATGYPGRQSEKRAIPLEQDPEVMLRMEKTFKKACRVLGIEMNRFFDTILEASLGDIDDLSATDAAAAVAAAAAGIRTPEDNVVVAPIVNHPAYVPPVMSITGAAAAAIAGSDAEAARSKDADDESRGHDHILNPVTPKKTPAAPPSSPTAEAVDPPAPEVKKRSASGRRWLSSMAGGAKGSGVASSLRVASVLESSRSSVVYNPMISNMRLVTASTNADDLASRSPEAAVSSADSDAMSEAITSNNSSSKDITNDAEIYAGEATVAEQTSEICLLGSSSSKRSMVVSKGVVMHRTEVSGVDTLIVKGDFHGNVDVKALEVESGAIVRGDASADRVSVGGTFDGKLRCKTLVVRRGGKCAGTVSYNDLHIEPGADVNADLVLSNTPWIESVAEEKEQPAPPSSENLEADGRTATGDDVDSVPGPIEVAAIHLANTLIRDPSKMMSILSPVAENPIESPWESRESVESEKPSVPADTTEEKPSVPADTTEEKPRGVIDEGAAVAERGRCPRRAWASKPVQGGGSLSETSGEAADMLPCPKPNRLLKKHVAMNATPAPSSSEGSPEQGMADEALLGLDSPIAGLDSPTAGLDSPTAGLDSPTAGLGAAVAAMEEKQQAVEAARQAEVQAQEKADDTIASAGLSAGVLAGGDSWTIRTKHITSVVPVAAVRSRPEPNKMHAVNMRFTSASAYTGVRKGAAAPRRLVVTVPVKNSLANSASARYRSRRYNTAEASVMVEEGKKALLAARKERRREHGSRPVSMNVLTSPSSSRGPGGRIALGAAAMEGRIPASPMVALPSPRGRSKSSRADFHALPRSPVRSLDRHAFERPCAASVRPPQTPSPRTLRSSRGVDLRSETAKAGCGISQDRPTPHQQGRGSSTVTPGSKLADRCAAFLIHLVRSSTSTLKPASPAPSARHSGPQQPPPSPNSRTPKCTPPVGLRENVGDGKSSVPGQSERVPGADPVKPEASRFHRLGPLRLNKVRADAGKARDDPEASPGGVPLVRQRRFRRSTSLEEKGTGRLRAREMSSTASLSRTGGTAVHSKSGSGTRPSGADAKNPSSGFIPGGFGGMSDTLSARRKVRAWRKVSSGTEIGSLWQ